MDQDSEDDMIVFIVVDENSRQNIKNDPNKKSEDESSSMLDDIIENVEIYGQYILQKEEISQNYDDEGIQNVIKPELYDYDAENTDNAQNYTVKEEYVPDFEDHIEADTSAMSQDTEKHRFTMLKPWERNSFVAELRENFADLEGDEDVLVKTLEHFMSNVKPPPPPRDYYIMNGIMFECVKCGHISETIPAASRHYQEKHGERYLVCYACGVDFRSTTNLYKHEKRCVAPDARIVLRARAAFLGSKGRSRPYMRTKSRNKKPMFPCTLCSAVFMTRSNLQSHHNLHLGERPYRCHACPRAYTSYSALSRHTKKHSDIQFICDYCNRSFNVKASLVSHMDTHRPLRKHGCEECGRRFSQKAALLLHINRVHRNLPPPCACQICPKRYPRMSLLKDHMKREHGMTIITRKMFFKSLPTMTELEVQQSKVIFKSDDNVVHEASYDTEEMFQRCKEENIRETVKINNDGEIPGSIEIDGFIQYVLEGDGELNGEVYVQNYEVIEPFETASDSVKLENIVSNGVLPETTMGIRL